MVTFGEINICSLIVCGLCSIIQPFDNHYRNWLNKNLVNRYFINPLREIKICRRKNISSVTSYTVCSLEKKKPYVYTRTSDLIVWKFSFSCAWFSSFCCSSIIGAHCRSVHKSWKRKKNNLKTTQLPTYLPSIHASIHDCGSSYNYLSNIITYPALWVDVCLLLIQVPP